MHLKDNGLSSNCNYLDVILKDTLAPRIRSGCGKIVTLFANCTAVMPNLASTLSIAENCSAISIYQLPKPGNILNDGVENYPGLASGVERIFTCLELTKTLMFSAKILAVRWPLPILALIVVPFTGS